MMHADFGFFRVPSAPRTPGKMTTTGFPVMEKSWNFNFNKYHGKMTVYLENWLFALTEPGLDPATSSM